MALDPHFDKVALLLHFDGADGSTTFIDSSSTPKALTAYSGAVISTAQSKWGGASGYFDGVDDYVSAPSSSDFNFGTGDFTIEAWVYQSQQSGLAMVAGQQGENASDGLFQFRISDGKPEFVFCSNGSTSIVSFSSQQPIQQSTWVHIEVSRSNGVGRVFVGGLLTAQANISGSLYNSNRPLTVGALNYGVGTNLLGFFGGYIDDLRITKGVARNSANFTPPTEAFADSATPTVASAYAAAATPLGAPAVLTGHPLPARIAAPTPLGTVQALLEFNSASKARLSVASPLCQSTAVAVAVMQATASAATPLGNPAAVAIAITPVKSRVSAAKLLGAAQASAYASPISMAAAPTPLGDVQATAFAMVAGYAASHTPLGQPSALAFADMAALGTIGQNTAFGNPAVVLVNRVQGGVRLAEFIPPLTALQGMAPGSMAAQASSLPSPAFGKPSAQFSTSHEAASLDGSVAFGAPAVRSIHPADSFAPVQFGDVGAPAFAAHAASLQDGAQFGQPLAFTLHALPDWYAGLRFGAVAVQGTGVFPVLDGIQLGEFGSSEAGTTRHQAMPLHMLPQFGPVTISRGAMTC